MVTKMPTSDVLSVRVSPQEKALIKSAADQTRSTLGEFMRRKSLEGAEEAVLERTSVTIPANQWEAFEAMMDAPAKASAEIRALAAHKPVWLRQFGVYNHYSGSKRHNATYRHLMRSATSWSDASAAQQPIWLRQFGSDYNYP